MSTLNVEAISHPTSGSNVTINGIAPAGTNQLGNRNLIINGAMQVAQRGSAETTTSGYATLDRWLATHGGSGTMGQSQQTLSSGSPYDEGFRYFMRLKNNSVVTSFDNSSRTLFQYIEAQNVAGSGWNYTSISSYVTLSFWVRSSVAQNFYGFVRSHDGTSQSYPFETGSLTADTWTKITKTIPGDADVAFDNNNGVGIELSISAYLPTANTDSSVTLDAWMTRDGSQRTPDFTQTWASTANATFDITGVQLEVGSVATPFEHRSYGQELSLCQRYYQLMTNFSNSFYATGTSESGFFNYEFKVPMRQAPTVTITSTATTSRLSSLNVSTTGIDTVSLQAVSSSSGMVYLYGSTAANASAEL
jgi:hypothetical protein